VEEGAEECHFGGLMSDCELRECGSLIYVFISSWRCLYVYKLFGMSLVALHDQ
jgi:hypothetical protein